MTSFIVKFNAGSTLSIILLMVVVLTFSTKNESRMFIVSDCCAFMKFKEPDFKSSLAVFSTPIWMYLPKRSLNLFLKSCTIFGSDSAHNELDLPMKPNSGCSLSE